MQEKNHKIIEWWKKLFAVRELKSSFPLGYSTNIWRSDLIKFVNTLIDRIYLLKKDSGSVIERWQRSTVRIWNQIHANDRIDTHFWYWRWPLIGQSTEAVYFPCLDIYIWKAFGKWENNDISYTFYKYRLCSFEDDTAVQISNSGFQCWTVLNLNWAMTVQQIKFC